MKELLVGIAALILVAGCSGSPNSALGTGNAFVDAHYVRIDLETSKGLCTGVAADKVDAEIALTSEIEIESDTQRPHISYDLREERPLGDAVQLVYELSIRAPGLDPYSKFTIVTVREHEGGWAVSNYMEMDSL